MIILFHPRATKPRNRRLPLAVLALAAVLEGVEEYEIVDGNVDDDPLATVLNLIDTHNVELIGASVMPGPQMAAAMELSREVRRLRPRVPIAWGGYFPSIYPDAALNARYVDYIVRGQGEDTLLELIAALRGCRPLESILGLAYKDAFGLHRINPERPMKDPDEFPWSPFHRLPVEKYLRPSFFGKRTAVHHASIGCPFNCSFCGVHAAYGRIERMESPERTYQILKHLVDEYGADSVQFYDMNFFLREDHARELMNRIAPLNLRWWCEARVDIMSRYSDDTMAAIERAGCAMIFFGAESGSNWVLEEMQKGITVEETEIMAHRTRQFNIIPEFSFVIGNPRDPDRDTRETLSFIRKLKRINPDSEIILQHYTPTPQPGNMYGDLNGKISFPSSPAEWATKEWMDFTLRIDTHAPWLKHRTKKLIDNFELVVASRWPTVQDILAPQWSRLLLQALSAWRYAFGVYSFPFELRLAHQYIGLRKPKRGKPMTASAMDPITMRRPAIPATFDLWAEVYDEQPNPFLQLEQRVLASILPADLTNLDVLDAGCGTGRLLTFLQQRKPRSLVGVDSSPAMLAHAAQHYSGDLRRGSCIALPVSDAAVDCVLCSFVLSYISDLELFADEVARVTRPGAMVLLSDLHPRTAHTLGWRRSFPWSGMEIEISSYSLQLDELRETFAERGFSVSVCVEPSFAVPEQRLFRQAGRSAAFDAMNNPPAIYVLALRREPEKPLLPQLSLCGAHYALSPFDSTLGTLDIHEGKIGALDSAANTQHHSATLYLSGYLVLPGLVNAHDHLEFGLFPRLGHGPYQNAKQWADDIHMRDAELIALHRAVPREATIYWGAIRNLLCGVTSVCHHNPLTPEMFGPDFPVTVLDRFYWAHSLALDPNLAAKAHVTNPDQPFLFHAAEGIDAQSAEEFSRLDSLGVLSHQAVLIHGLALSLANATELNDHGAALITCPTSNDFLFARLPSSDLLASITNLALGSDCPLTAAGDLLDELRFARKKIGLPDDLLYRMITTASAAILRISCGAGRITTGIPADLIAVRDIGKSPSATLSDLSSTDVELVLRSGKVFLASDAIYDRLPQPLRSELQPLLVNGERRWLRAPLQQLFEQARSVMQNGTLLLAGKEVRLEQPL